MVSLKNKKTTINSQPTNWFDWIKAAVEQTPEKGFTPSVMRSRLRVLDAIANAKNDTLTLEDADKETLKQCVNDMRWAVLHNEILEFTDFVEKI